MTANVVGLGYVGVSTCLYLLSLGHRISGWDIDPERMESLQGRVLPFRDEDLLALYQTIDHNRFALPTHFEDLPNAELWLICVSTQGLDNGSLEISNVLSAIRRILTACVCREQNNPVLVLRSTIPPLTYKVEIEPILREFRRIYQSFNPVLYYFPEFMREGHSIQDHEQPALSIVGGDETGTGLPLLESLFKIPSGGLTLLPPEVVEMVKISSNAFHALKVTFANEIAVLCKQLNINSIDVMKTFVQDSKLNLSPYYLRPGFAFGGPCLDKDLKGLQFEAEQRDLNLPLLNGITASNTAHIDQIANLIQSKITGDSKIGFFGLGFKKNSLDTRGSPILCLIERLKSRCDKCEFHILNENQASPDSTALRYKLHSSIESIIREVSLLVLGSRSVDSDERQMISNFQGPIIDLMFHAENSSYFRGLNNYIAIS